MTITHATEPGSRLLPEPDLILKARVAMAQADVRRSLAAVTDPSQPPADPWRRARLLDSAIAGLSAHVTAMRSTLHPAARRALPDSRAQIAAYLQAQRRIEHLMRSLHQALHGDARAAGRSTATLYSMLSTAFEAYAEREASLLAALQQVSTLEQQRTLMRDIKTALAGAPTRPHPYLPRALSTARPVSRAVAMWDDMLDEVHGRSTHRGTGHPLR
jgi:plasmid stabilization system protein ParE